MESARNRPWCQQQNARLAWRNFGTSSPRRSAPRLRSHLQPFHPLCANSQRTKTSRRKQLVHFAHDRKRCRRQNARRSLPSSGTCLRRKNVPRRPTVPQSWCEASPFSTDVIFIRTARDNKAGETKAVHIIRCYFCEVRHLTRIRTSINSAERRDRLNWTVSPHCRCYDVIPAIFLTMSV